MLPNVNGIALPAPNCRCGRRMLRTPGDPTIFLCPRCDNRPSSTWTNN